MNIDQELLTLVQERGIELITTYGGRLLAAIVVWVVGLFIIRRIRKAVHAIFLKTEFDEALETFAENLIDIILKVLLAVMAISLLGVPMTSFIALLGAAGLAIGLSLQGSLSNFAGGALILFFKPFTVGDRIETPNHTGTVEEIQILYTILRNRNNHKIVIPNGDLANYPVKNFFSNDHFGVENTFGIGYGDDIDKAKGIVEKIIANDPRVLQDPAPYVGVSELADSSVNIFTRVFVNKREDWWDIKFDMTEAVKKEFDKQGVSIPFPQRDVHLYKHNN